MDEQTIAALATPAGRGALAVIRLSGPETAALLPQILLGWPAQPRPWRLYHRPLQAGGQPVCDGLAVFFRAPRSYTGEDAAEISIPASPVLTGALLAELARRGARPALPGEFTFRAYRNGRIDLIQAEAVLELVRAASRSEAHMEFATLEGGLSRAVAALRQQVVDAAVRLETAIEFQEENRLEEAPAAAALVEALRALQQILSQARFQDEIRSGLRVAIAGPVNAGKSTLFNSLLLQERAITSPHPGTTRDFILETLDLDGFPVELSDAAGIRRSGDPLEEEGVRRSHELVAASQAVLLVLDAARPAEVTEEIGRLGEGKPRLLLANKADVAAAADLEALRTRFPGAPLHPVSALTGANLEVVHDWLRGLAQERGAPPGALAVNRRQKMMLERVRDCLGEAQRHLQQAEAAELAAEELRAALGAIGELTGEVRCDDLLEAVFSRFCIGK